MAIHLIPDDGAEHTPNVECACGVRPIRVARPDGTTRDVWAHGVDLSDEEAWSIRGHVFQLNPGYEWTEVDIRRDRNDRLRAGGGVYTGRE